MNGNETSHSIATDKQSAAIGPAPSPTTYIPVIDSLRGIAAVSVMLFHFVCRTEDFVQSALILNFFHFGQLGVQMFFVISGIVIPLSLFNKSYVYKNAWRFLLKRLLRLEPCYLATIVLALAYLNLRNWIPGSAEINLTPSVKGLMLHIAYLIPFFRDFDWVNPVFWTLAIEFQYYLLTAAMFPVLFSRCIWIRIPAYACLLVLAVLIPNEAFVFRWLPVFSFGIAYVGFRCGRLSKYEAFALLATIAVVCGLVNGLPTLVVSVATLLIIHFLPHHNLPGFWKLGALSYSLYLVHSITGAPVVYFLSHRVDDPLSKFFVVAVGCMISFAAALGMYILVEKPSMRWSKRFSLNP